MPIQKDGYRLATAQDKELIFDNLSKYSVGVIDDAAEGTPPVEELLFLATKGADVPGEFLVEPVAWIKQKLSAGKAVVVPLFNNFPIGPPAGMGSEDILGVVASIPNDPAAMQQAAQGSAEDGADHVILTPATLSLPLIAGAVIGVGLVGWLLLRKAPAWGSFQR